MSGGSAATGGYYYLEEVPWTCYFYSGYALHGAYWHDGFGIPRSHGCVNLSLYDSWWIFQWSERGGRTAQPCTSTGSNVYSRYRRRALPDRIISAVSLASRSSRNPSSD